MHKIGMLLTTIVIIIILNLILVIMVPFLADITVTVNTTLNASSNMSLYPGTSGFLLATPWIMYFIPNVIGVIVVIMILRRQD